MLSLRRRVELARCGLVGVAECRTTVGRNCWIQLALAIGGGSSNRRLWRVQAVRGYPLVQPPIEVSVVDVVFSLAVHCSFLNDLAVSNVAFAPLTAYLRAHGDVDRLVGHGLGHGR